MGTTSSITLTGPAKDVDLIVQMLVEQAKRRHGRGYPNVAWDMESTEPPANQYFTRDSILQVQIYPNTSTSTVTVSYKLLLPNGKITLGQTSITGLIGAARNQSQISLDEGFLLSLAVTITNSGAIIQRGDTFVQISVTQTAVTTSPTYRVLISDYVSTICAIGWPDGNLRANTDGTGYLLTITPSNPGAGADWSYTFGNTFRYWLHSATATLTTSVTAANRIPIFTLLSPGGAAVWQMGPLAVQTASKVVVYNLGECVTLSTDAAGNAAVPLPTEMFLLGNQILKSVTSGIQTTDQWSAIAINFEVWFQL